MANIRASDVFTPGKLPTVTFVEEHLRQKKTSLMDSVDMGGSVISLSGPSKSGKTVFVENALGKDNLIQITGAGVDSVEKLWSRVFDYIGTPVTKKVTKKVGFSAEANGKMQGKVGFLVEGGAEVGVKGVWNDGEEVTKDSAVDYLQLLIKEIGNTDFIIFIDDFHYIQKNIQSEISNQIKEAIRNNVKIICAAVPYHSDDVIRANPDLRGRMIKIDFGYWELPYLKLIAQKGFPELGMEVGDAVITALAMESAGSPQLMQALCLNYCYESEIREKVSDRYIDCGGRDKINRTCKRSATMNDYSSTVKKMREGPKTRGMDRNKYFIKSGQSVDIYPMIMMALALNPPELTFSYSVLLDRIRNLCVGISPTGSSITGACTHIAKIANESENNLIVEWDAEREVIDIRDPYLLFYVRWADN